MAKNRGLSFYRRKKKISSATVREIFVWIFGILASVFIAGVLSSFFGMTIHVVGMSMEPELYNGQKIYIDRFIYIMSTPKRGDVIVFLPNGNENAHYYVKRVAGVPGDKLLIQNNVLYVNGEESEYFQDTMLDAGILSSELSLSSGEYFCIGDNPENSEDSRSANIGPVKESTIIGKAWFRAAAPMSSMGLIQ